MDCAQVRAESVAERYLLGQLGEPDRTSFEEHFFKCSACFGEVERMRALGDELARSRRLIEAGALRSSSLRRWAWVAAAVLAAVAGGLGLWARFLQQSAPSLGVAELARFDPPAYTPLRLRGSEDETARRFTEAMEHYVRGDFASALAHLQAAGALAPDAANIGFFEGACALLTGRTDEAIAAFQRTIQLGDTPFLEEARFALAKAYLHNDDEVAAREQLEGVVALNGEHRLEAQRLLGVLSNDARKRR